MATIFRHLKIARIVDHHCPSVAARTNKREWVRPAECRIQALTRPTGPNACVQLSNCSSWSALTGGARLRNRTYVGEKSDNVVGAITWCYARQARKSRNLAGEPTTFAERLMHYKHNYLTQIRRRSPVTDCWIFLFYLFLSYRNCKINFDWKTWPSGAFINSIIYARVLSCHYSTLLKLFLHVTR